MSSDRNVERPSGSKPGPASLASKTHAAIPDAALEPWDIHSAEALMSLYETASPSQVTRAAPAAFFVDPPEPRRGSAPAAHVANTMTNADPRAAGCASENNTWLEDRLAAMTSRIENSVSAARPEASLNLLTTRLDQLEKQFGIALEKVATRTDVDGLRIIEAHIAELTTQIADTQKQLQRLESIESHLQDLSAYAAAAGEPSPAPAITSAAPLALPDFDSVADNTADRVLSRLAGMPPKPAAEAEHIDQIQQMLQSFIAEHHRQSANTANALDTMQDVLVNLIDRVEAIQSSAAPVWPAASPAAQPLAAARAPDAASDFSLDGFTQDHQQPFHAAGQQSRDHRDIYQQAVAAYAAPAATNPVEPTPDINEQPAHVADAIVPPAVKTNGLALRRDLEAAALRAKMKAAGTPATQPSSDQHDQDARPAPAPTPRQRPANTNPPSSAPNKRALAVLFFGLAMTGAGYFGWRLHNDGYLRNLTAKFDGKIAPSKIEPTATQEPRRDGAPIKITPRSSVVEDNAPAQALRKGNDVPAQLAELPDALKSDANGDGQPAAGGDASLPRADAERGSIMQTSSLAVSKSGVPLGISVQHGPMPPNPIDLAAAQQRPLAASTSLRPGQPAPKSAETLDAATIPTSLPASGTGRPNDPAPSVVGEQTGIAVELPPATVGPLSLRLAAQRGDPGAEFEVAARLAEGKGVKQDFKLAMTWFQRAANHGLAPAQYRLATLYERGLSGSKPDLQRARVWYKRAADQGNVKAMHNLAVLSAGRESGKPDYATAAQWFTEAAERGLPDSQFNLGVLYENGLGVAQDGQQAYKWFALAVRGGDKEAAKRRDQMATKLDPAAFAAAEQLVASWQARQPEAPANDPRIGAEALRARGAQMDMPPSAPPTQKPVSGKAPLVQ